MNYRHAYHAGNHADVLKHIVLVRVLDHLRRKDKPFAALDAHAGIGRYDLKGSEAFKTGEWKVGIGKLLAEPVPPDVRPLLQLYLNIIHDLNPDGTLRTYPGSPEVLSRILRREDRILLNELHPEDADTLAVRYSADKRVRVTRLDAAVAAKAALPFTEKRGVVLLDPAFEIADEIAKTLRMARHIIARMQNAVLLVWYPLKAPDDSKPFLDGITALERPGTLAAELLVREPFAEGGLAGSGMAIINPPYKLQAELEIILPFLALRMGMGKWGRGSVTVLTPPH